MTAGASAFTVTVDGAARGVDEVAVAGSRVRLTLAVRGDVASRR